MSPDNAMNFLGELGQAPPGSGLSFPLCAEARLQMLGSKSCGQDVGEQPPSAPLCGHVDASGARCCCKVGLTTSAGSWASESSRVIKLQLASP